MSETTPDADVSWLKDVKPTRRAKGKYGRDEARAKWWKKDEPKGE